MDLDSRTKREELKTYSTLGLKRTLKSRSQRRRILARGAQIILGSGRSDEPEIMVRRDLYTRVRLEVMGEQLRLARESNLDLAIETLQDLLAPKIERETYQRILTLSTTASRLETAFLQTHARLPTRGEQKIFHDQRQPSSKVGDQTSHRREDILEEVLGAIEERRQNSSGRLQSVWAEVVGAEISQQSSLEKVDAGVAWFRCLSSALSYQLQRRPELPAKLAAKLRQPVRQLRASY